MRKIMALFLIILLVASPVACGKNVQTPAPTESTQPVMPPEQENEPEYIPGVTEGAVYESEFLRIGCHIPEGWRYYSPEKLLGLLDITADPMLGYELFAVGGAESLGMYVEKAEDLEPEQYLQSKVPTLEQAYAGAAEVRIELTTALLDGVNKDCLRISAVQEGKPVEQAVLCLRCEAYLVSITAVAGDETRLEEVLEFFYLF